MLSACCERQANLLFRQFATKTFQSGSDLPQYMGYRTDLLMLSFSVTLKRVRLDYSYSEKCNENYF
jgi:hypothetical protein